MEGRVEDFMLEASTGLENLLVDTTDHFVVIKI